VKQRSQSDSEAQRATSSVDTMPTSLPRSTTITRCACSFTSCLQICFSVASGETVTTSVFIKSATLVPASTPGL